MSTSATCPTTFHQCPRSADHDGFSVLDRATGQATPARSEADARQIAERDYPSCTFALSTITRVHPDIELPIGTPDAVVMAILRRLDGDRFTVVAYVLASVVTPSCVPFSQEIWQGAKDHLPKDHRRPTRRAS